MCDHIIIFCSTIFEHDEYDCEEVECLSMLPDHASPEFHVGRYRFTSHPTCDRGEFSTSLRECTESLETNKT